MNNIKYKIEDYDQEYEPPYDLVTYEYDICDWCNGSGEGKYDGSRCWKCNGSGAIPSGE